MKVLARGNQKGGGGGGGGIYSRVNYGMQD